MTEQPLRAHGYGRVSGAEQAKNQNPRTQVAEIERCAERQGFTLGNVYMDEGVSGKVPPELRPAARAMLADAAAGRFDVLIITAWDRWSRDTGSGLIAKAALEGLGVRIFSINEPFTNVSGDDEDEDDFAEVGTTYSLMHATWERKRIRKRTRAGRRDRVKRGELWHTGTVPYGYRRSADGKHIEVDETQAPVVRRIFALAASGYGAVAIAKLLDADGVPPPHATRTGHTRPTRIAEGWPRSTIAKMLVRRMYSGRTLYGGAVEATCPAIITEELFEQVQHGLRLRKERSPRRTKPNRDYLLARLLKCGTCGHAYTVSTYDSGRVSYCCNRRRLDGPAGGHTTGRWRYFGSELEQPVIEAVRAIYDNPATALAQAEVTFDAIKQSLSDAPAQIATIDRQLADIEAQTQRASDALVRGLIDEAEFGRQRDRLRDERARVEARRTELAGEADSAAALAASLDMLAAWMRSGHVGHAPGFYDETTGLPVEPTLEEWRSLITALVDEITVEPDGTLLLHGPGDAVIAATVL